MATPIRIPAWQRPHWHSSGEKIYLHFYVFGNFENVRVPSAPYGSDGLPRGIEVTNHHHSALRQWDGYPLRGELGRMFKEEVPDAYRAAVDAPQVMILRGTLDDQGDIGYLRDTLGVIAGLLDIGGVAVLDPQIVTLFDASAWRNHYLVRDGAPIRNHLLILCDDEEEGEGHWIRTRGLRKFGRPDVSLRHVPEGQIDRAGMLCERLAEMQALGASFQDGQPLQADGMDGFVAKIGGGDEEPPFYNTFVEFRWPA